MQGRGGKRRSLTNLLSNLIILQQKRVSPFAPGGGERDPVGQRKEKNATITNIRKKPEYEQK